MAIMKDVRRGAVCVWKELCILDKTGVKKLTDLTILRFRLYKSLKYAII